MPGISIDDVDSYIWRHIEVDMEVIKTVLATGDNLDDIFTMMHVVIDRLGDYEQGLEWACHYNFRRKEGRKLWEEKFTKTVLQPVIEKMTEAIAGKNKMLAEDTRLGAQPLLRHIYEVDNELTNDNVEEIYANPCMWRYRIQLNFQHMCTQLEAKHGSSKDVFAVLKLFAEEDPVLQAMKYVPDILTLQRKLIFKYTNVTRIDRREANEITVAKLIEAKAAGDETERLIASFTCAWQIVREQLKTYVCVTEYGTAKVDTKYCQGIIDGNTPLSVLLPTQKGPGLCSFALIDLFFRRQNNFIDCYAQLHKRDRKTIHHIVPTSVTAAHLICYDHENDIRPLIFANCQYSLELGQGTKIEYDFQGLERQLVDRIFFSKSFIDVGVVLKIDIMEYRSDVTNLQIFEELGEKIVQESLHFKVKDVIYEESNNLPEVCRSIDVLDIAIRFLRSTGGEPDMHLFSYLKEKLQMTTELCSQKAEEVCTLKHCRSLWLALSLHKTKLLMNGEQEVFDALDKQFHDDLPDESLSSLHGIINSLTEKELANFVDKLHEFIIMKLTVNEKTNGSEYSGDSSKQKLPDWLNAYYEFDEDEDDVHKTKSLLPPCDILNCHCVAVWKTANTVLKSKHSN